MSHMLEYLLFPAVYAITLLVVWLLNRREFKRAPEKGRRYAALPMRLKLCCWFGVAPCFAGSLIHPLLFVPAVGGMLWLEGACVRWYRRAGLL